MGGSFNYMSFMRTMTQMQQKLLYYYYFNVPIGSDWHVNFV